MVEGALPIDGRITLEPTGAGTRMAFHCSGRPSGAMRLATPLLKRGVIKQPVRRAFPAATLKRVLEKQTQG